MIRSPRQRLMDFGPAVLKDAELVAVLLQGGSVSWSQARYRAEALLAAFPKGLAGMGRSVERGAKPRSARPYGSNVTVRQIATLSASVELGLRTLAATAEAHRPLLDTPERVARHIAKQQPTDGDVGLLGLDGRRRMVCMECLGPSADPRACLSDLYQRSMTEAVLWRWCSSQPTVRGEDRSLCNVILEGSCWLGLRLRALVLGAGGAWLPMMRHDEPDH